MHIKRNIKIIENQALADFLVQHNEPTFRLKQIQYWLFSKNVSEFSPMTNLSSKLRPILEDNLQIIPRKDPSKFDRADGTIRYVSKLSDGTFTESVLMIAGDRITVCISSQVGCSLNCKFCATGYLPYKRNLYAGEIYEQVYVLNGIALSKYAKPVSNIVYMGMGEPLLNYKNLIDSINHITSSEAGLGLSSKRITISTSGIAKIIERLALDSPRSNLALSLHAACDSKRSQIMSINDSNSISTLVESLNKYYSITKNLITIEYILFNNFNYSLKDDKELLNICRKVPTKVNLLEYNPIDSFKSLSPASTNKIALFQKFLIDSNIITTVRYSKGRDIAAACGQLAYKFADKSTL
ncbi:MAG: 23S rRNA (adenine(2503)-C(2))-methyltransferase RlmN [Solitalea-like symbiont of Acarus siro]